jgi:integrase
LIKSNPCSIKGAGLGKSPERPIASIEEVFALANAIDDRYRLAIFLATFAGLRLGELLGLERISIDLESSTLHITQQMQELSNGRYYLALPKSEAGKRTIAVPDFVIDEIRHHLDRFVSTEDSSLLFTGGNRSPLRRGVLFKAWKKARTEVGVEYLHFHDLRHTGNTLAAMTGASTKELMSRMCHSSSEAALRYQHATRDRDVAIASKLNSMASEYISEIKL